jgi:hypothetical protein
MHQVLACSRQPTSITLSIQEYFGQTNAFSSIEKIYGQKKYNQWKNDDQQQDDRRPDHLLLLRQLYSENSSSRHEL